MIKGEDLMTHTIKMTKDEKLMTHTIKMARKIYEEDVLSLEYGYQICEAHVTTLTRWLKEAPADMDAMIKVAVIELTAIWVDEALAKIYSQ